MVAKVFSPVVLALFLSVLHIGVSPWPEYQSKKFLENQYDQVAWRKAPGVASTATQIDERLSPGNITILQGETAMLACKIYNLGNKSVSWLRHSLPLPQLMALNNQSNSLDTRVKAMAAEEWSEFVLMIRDVGVRDSGQYECQVSGPNHTSISQMIQLTVIAPVTSIDGGPDLYVGLHSRLSLVCRIDSGGLQPRHLIWRKGHKMLSFLGGEGSSFSLEKDQEGRFVSRITVERIDRDSGDTYGCQPSPGPAAEVKVHVIREGTMLTVQNNAPVLNTAVPLPLLLVTLLLSLTSWPLAPGHWLFAPGSWKVYN